MPHYDYICPNCKHAEEIFQKITASPLTVCPQCQSNSFHRKPGGGGGLIYRCTGFYETDYNSATISQSDSPSGSSGSSSGSSGSSPSSSSSCCPCGKPSSCS